MNIKFTEKNQVISYIRDRTSELIEEVEKKYGKSEYKKRASSVNRRIGTVRKNLINNIEQEADRRGWSSNELLDSVLTTTYASYVVMLEARNYFWPYEYMTFSRRMGELWEPFCKLCWEYTLKDDLSFFVPPTFKSVKKNLMDEVKRFIEGLGITKKEKRQLKEYYDNTWRLVGSGKVKLELDLHFQDRKNKYNVDFKSGFSSNEKGNTNRLLLVASIYSVAPGDYNCVLLIRSKEEENNNYLQTLKKSGLWDVYTGLSTYRQIEKYTGFDLSNWMQRNIDWRNDFSDDFYNHLQKNELLNYLKW